ncbi:Oidioi.mRNA.OKI2018_I69.chr1.g1316.t1.cds [Oikopleura dioica]|uniref:Sulfotransferase n=1 Tax=Oikopleura dioica TaxID=34765 RepID=A0ABN7SRB7_OIKDI|nr:Oidioi.mRNA.OKI2018_I69.chr1.g1316.t1.cds [Oikopleura dioica]
MQYLIRWQGYKPEDDTWEPEENIRDRRIIDDWEKKNSADEATKSTGRGKRGKASSSFAAATKKGFARGLVPERILGASRIVDENGKRTGEEKLYYIIKWINSEQADIVTAEEAKQKCPYLVFKFYEERILPEQETAEERIQSAMEPKINCLRMNKHDIIKNELCYPKSGSHLMMSILDAIGIRRLETLGLKDTVVNSLDQQLAAIRQYEGLVHTNHCHLYPSNFPLGHKGKIVFVERATPAVVVSAYHYLKKLPSMRPYLKKYGINEDLQKFARFMFEGKHYWGSSEEYNKQWREFAEDHPELQIEFFKFGEVMADKPKEISRLLKFLEIENADLAEIVANARKKFYEKELETGEVIEHNGAFYTSAMAGPETLEKLRNADFPENAVTVLGFPKSGSHLMMSILDAIGITRLETLVAKDKHTFHPMEFRPNVAALDDQLAAIREHKGLVHTTHCHVNPGNFPLGHKGKIVFIERDTPAVVVSAFHFFKKLPFMEPYMKKHGIYDDLQTFARFMFEGKQVFGTPEEYNQQWKAFAKEHPELKIEFFKFKEVVADKPKEISRLLKFLEIENADLAKIVEMSDIKKHENIEKKKPKS